MTRDDLAKFRELDIDFESIGLIQAENTAYFCTPLGAEYVGWLGCDGIHFVLLPGDERVFCVDPAMGEIGTYVLPVAADFREFLSFVLYCRDANPLSELSWLSGERFRQMLREEAGQPGNQALEAKRTAALDAIVHAFGLTPRDPYEAVKALQSAFDPACLTFSEEYYDVLGLEDPRNG